MDSDHCRLRGVERDATPSPCGVNKRVVGQWLLYAVDDRRVIILLVKMLDAFLNPFLDISEAVGDAFVLSSPPLRLAFVGTALSARQMI